MVVDWRGFNLAIAERVILIFYVITRGPVWLPEVILLHLGVDKPLLIHYRSE